MKRFLGATASAVLLSSPLIASAQGEFLRSVDDLADPRGYCLDIPGFGPRMQLDAAIYTHSCKYSLPGFDVDEILELADRKLRFVNYDRCLSADSMEAGASVHAIGCDAAHGWAIHPDGSVTPAAATQHCLTLSSERVFVNTAPGTVPPYSSRAVSLEPCSADATYRQRWRWSAPDERTTYNANSLRSGTPAGVRQRIREMGAVVDPRATAEIYRDARRAFGPGDVTVSAEIAYGADERHRLQVYEGVNRNPPGNGTAPVILLVHGGGFSGGSLANLAHVATHFAGLGFVAVNITYPLAPEHTWPSGAESVAAAVDWTVAHIGAYRGDPGRMTLMGHSAGGNHVANYVFRPSLSGHGTRVAGAILASPALLLDPRGPGEAYSGYFETDSLPWDGVRLLDNIEDTSVPVLITVAELDPEPAYRGTARLYSRLVDDFGARPRLRQIPAHGHISYITAIGTPDHRFVEEALDFILTER